jgi:hypothetical protein
MRFIEDPDDRPVSAETIARQRERQQRFIQLSLTPMVRLRRMYVATENAVPPPAKDELIEQLLKREFGS